MRSTSGKMPRSSLDLELFQNILASAFVVQQSLLDVHWLSVIPELRGLIDSGALSATGTMHLISGHAQNVANAAGTAIALVTKDQLIYRAGSGIAAGYVGRHVMATLSVSAKVERRGEILRVENADTDPRIGGAVCRQWGAKSLLILPIYHDQVLSGILAVFFSEPHTFQDQEISLYQSMIEVISDALSHSAKLPTLPGPMERMAPPTQAFPSNSAPRTSKNALPQSCGSSIAQTKKFPSHRAGNAVTKITFQGSHIPWGTHIWKIARRGAVVIVLAMACWIAYGPRRPASPLENSGGQTASAIEPQQQVPFGSAEQGSAKKDMSSPQTASVTTNDVRKTARITPRRVKIGDEEIDYISEDVTVRHFKHKPAMQQVRSGDDQGEYVSEDVTVWHFAPKLAVVPPKQQADRAAALPTNNWK